MWQKRFISIRSEFVLGGEIDSNGDIYLTGWTDGNLLSGEDVPGLMDVFLWKIDSEGKTLWIRQFLDLKNRMIQVPYLVAHDGNIYAGGSHQNPLNLMMVSSPDYPREMLL